MGVCLLIYAKLLTYPHMSWCDDQEMVFANTDVKTFNLKALFSSYYAGNYIPITMLVHALTFFLF